MLSKGRVSLAVILCITVLSRFGAGMIIGFGGFGTGLCLFVCCLGSGNVIIGGCNGIASVCYRSLCLKVYR
ncbi:hypothetical protein THS27_17525 [Thalassospira sp. MCCC 1A01428]|nr:hypothetical protein THS27_17525 [Thalassospira sp. MCCC 1A01428]